MTTVYDFTVKDRAGSDVSLADYKGKVLLIVNTIWKINLMRAEKALIEEGKEAAV